MPIYTSVQAHHQGARIWPLDDDEQTERTEIIGPAKATVTVRHPSDDTPYDLELAVHLVEGRYVVSDLKAMGLYERADYNAIADRTINHGDPPPIYVEAAKLGSITSRGLSEIRLASILQAALRGQCSVRRRLANGDVVTGLGPNDELEVVYVLARAVGEHPTQAVADALGISRSAAAQRVARARKLGTLPPATQGAR